MSEQDKLAKAQANALEAIRAHLGNEESSKTQRSQVDIEKDTARTRNSEFSQEEVSITLSKHPKETYLRKR